MAKPSEIDAAIECARTDWMQKRGEEGQAVFKQVVATLMRHVGPQVEEMRATITSLKKDLATEQNLRLDMRGRRWLSR